MRSLIASLRSLTLPYGSTSGERIVLDGVNGEIRIYDANDNLVIKIDGDNGFWAYNLTADAIVRIDETGLKIYADDNITLLLSADSTGFKVYGGSGTLAAILDQTGFRFYDALSRLIIQQDATEGIRLYDTAGHMIIQIDDTGLTAFDTLGHMLAKLSPDGLFIYDTAGVQRLAVGALGTPGGYSGLTLWSGGANETDPAVINLVDVGNLNQLLFTPGERGNQGALELMLQAAPQSNSRAPLIQVIGATLQSGNRRPLIDLTGADAPSGKEPFTVVHRLWRGIQVGKAFEPTLDGEYSKGIVDKVDGAAGTYVLSTTAGTYTPILNTNTIDVKANTYYQVYFVFIGNMLVSGSGFTTGDTWMMKFQKETTPGGGFTDLYSAGGSYVTRSNVAIAMRYMVPDRFGLYLPVAAGTVSFRLVVAKTSGAATVTSQLEGTPFIWVIEEGSY
jgi:hypothetical protein